MQELHPAPRHSRAHAIAPRLKYAPARMLAAPPPKSDRDEVIALLRAWQSAGGERADPLALGIKSIVAVPVHRIAISRIAENRGVKAQLRTPAGRRSLPPERRFDVWQLEDLEHGASAHVGRRLEKVLEDQPEMVSDCERCRGAGEIACTPCNGSGRIRSGQHAHHCGTCGGSGRVTCVSCTGLGGFSGLPVAWSEIVEGTVSRIVRPAGITDAAALDMHDVLARGLGSVVAKLDPWDGSTGAIPVPDEVRALALELEQNSVGRARWQRLEIRAAAVYSVALDDGRTFVTWGPPAKVVPEDVLDVKGAAAVRIVIMLLVGILVAMVLMWIGRHG